jgi:hypothetical protein
MLIRATGPAAFDPLRTLRGCAIIFVMSALRDFRNRIARAAPLIALAAIVVADLGAAAGRPHWAFYVVAFFVLLLAILVASRRAMPRYFCSTEQDLGFARNRDWLFYLFTNRGYPRKYWLLQPLWVAGFLLTGIKLPYVLLVIAAGLLLAAWASDQRKYPADLAATKVG